MIKKVQSVTENEDSERAAYIIERLSHRRPTDDEIQWILEHRAIAVTPILNILEDTARWNSLPERHANEPIQVIFLLAALEAREAWGPLKSILRKDFDGFVDGFFGDILTECLPWAMARIAKEETSALARLAGNSRLNTWIRNCALRALTVQALVWPGKEKHVLGCFRRWLGIAHLDPDLDWPTHLASALANLRRPEELKEEVHGLFQEELVDLLVIAEEDVYWTPQLDEARESIFDVYRHYGWLIA